MAETLLQAEGVIKYFPTRAGVVRAVDGVSLSLAKGETVGLVGESGCGKSTLGRLMLRLLTPDAGRVVLQGNAGGDLEAFRRRVQIVFQDPYRSLNPRRTVGDAIAEPLLIHRMATKGDVRGRVAELLQEVGLDPGIMDRYPAQFSGGQRQRIGIARALAVRPEVIVLDEPISALDVSVQAQIIYLLDALQRQYGLTYLFISHNLGVVRHIADRVAVMYLGKIVEQAPVEQLYASPRHPYTRALLDAVPEPDPTESIRARLSGDAPDPILVPPGCRFHPRCQLAAALAEGGERVPGPCREQEPALREIEASHWSACHFAERVGERG